MVIYLKIKKEVNMESCNKIDGDIVENVSATEILPKNRQITLDLDYFEHLLNCLANQKFIGEKPPNGDAMAIEESEYNKIQRENQKIIDKAWNQGMFLLTLDGMMNRETEKIHNLYVEYWNSHLDDIKKILEEDMKEFPKDENISFKLNQLVTQEIEMWIRLGCNSAAIIDCENCMYKIRQVRSDDFEFIIERRGFTPKQIKLLREILVYIGIGENIKGG